METEKLGAATDGTLRWPVLECLEKHGPQTQTDTTDTQTHRHTRRTAVGGTAVPLSA